MYYHNYKHRNNTRLGFVALLSTIIISAVLLVITIEISQAGFYTRFIVLGTEWKLQSHAVAQSCGEMTFARVLIDPAWTGDSTITVPNGSCRIYSILKNYPNPGFLTIRVSGEVEERITNLKLVYMMGSIYQETVPLTSQPPASPFVIPILVSSTEVAVWP